MSDESDLNKKLFINYLTIERSLSDNTISAYSNDIDKFFKYAEDIKLIRRLNKISSETISQFLNYINRSEGKFKKKYSSKSVSRYISSLKSLFKYLEAEKIISVSPAESIETPRHSRLLPEVLSVEEIEKLFLQQDLANKLELRDKALLETLYASGLRVSEAINLEISNIFFEDGFLRVTGKGSKERIVPIGNTALKFITKYIKESRVLLKNKNSYNYLFLNFRGSKLSRMGVLTL
jgi:integrase/recombinase XerD